MERGVELGEAKGIFLCIGFSFLATCQLAAQLGHEPVVKTQTW